MELSTLNDRIEEFRIYWYNKAIEDIKEELDKDTIIDLHECEDSNFEFIYPDCLREKLESLKKEQKNEQTK